MRFIVDTMLGSLVRWLRVFGFDAVYAKDMEDSEIVDVSIMEARTLVSRDRELCGRVQGAILIDSTELRAQINHVLGLHEPDTGRILTRCLECNAVLEPVEKSAVEGSLPDSVRRSHEVFWQCPGCRKVYWRGSHYENMLREARSILAQCES